MNFPHSTPVPRIAKPGKRKPSRPPGFPLFAHAAGQWAKKVRGKLRYFGPWADPQAALEKWLAQKDDLLAGRTPREFDPDALTVIDLGELFLQSRERRVQTGEMAQCTFDEYRTVAAKAVDLLGKNTPVEQLRPDDFARLRSKLAMGCNLKTLEGRIAGVRAIFNYADKNGLIEKSLSRIWGTEFAKPSKPALQKLSNETTRLFSADEVWRLLEKASPTLTAKIYLGLNGGLGPTDLAKLRFDQVDLDSGWLEQSRSKTGRKRRIPIWPETVKALQLAIANRQDHKDKADADYIFITKQGNTWIPKGKDNPLSKEFAKLRKLAGITGRGKSFYSLRHSFQTVGDEVKDFVAVSSIMGHAASSISDHYRERIGDDRLTAVTDHVRKWLLSGKPKAKRKARKGGAA